MNRGKIVTGVMLSVIRGITIIEDDGIFRSCFVTVGL